MRRQFPIQRYHPRLEVLEDRTVPSGTPDHAGTVRVEDPATADLESFYSWMGDMIAPNPTYDPETGTPGDETADDLVDSTLLHVDVDPALYGGRPGGVLIRIEGTAATPTTANFDMFVYRSDASGARFEMVASARNWQNLPEATAVLQASGYYLIQVVYTGQPAADADSGSPWFVGAARFVHPDDWSPRVGVEALGLRPFRPLTNPTLTPEFNATGNFVGLVESFDGMTLSTRVRVPTETQLSTINEPQPLPTLLWQSGFPGQRSGLTGSEVDFEGYVKTGYALASFSVRGVEGSCGPAPANVLSNPFILPADVETPRGPGGDPTCAEGYSHIVDRKYEVRDAQHLLGVLVDYGVADSQRLGMGGVSWGGGQAWMLATSPRWLSPFGGQTLQLAAALPYVGWTDFQDAFIPNGRATDAVDQSASHERPFGVVTDRLRAGILLAGAVSRMNHDNPAELHSYADGWFAFIEAGEPFDSSTMTVPDPKRPGETVTITAAAISEALRDKSAYYADDYFAALSARTIDPVPIFAIQGWTDALFPAVQSLQMYRKLMAADPDYPIWMTFGDVGHEIATKPAPVLKDIFTRAKEFLDFYLKGIGQPPTDRVVSYETQYLTPTPTVLPPVIRGPDWDSMIRGVLRLTKGADDTRTTTSGPPNLAEEVRTDPLVAGFKPITQDPGSYDDLADWTWPVPPDGFTLLGMPRVTLNYQMLLGDHAMVAAKLWDVDPNGKRTLITRGVYRLSVAGGDRPSGTLSFQLFGNHYKLRSGHRITLELSQTDVPFLQPDKLPSSILFWSPELNLPTVEAPRLHVSDVTAAEGHSGMTEFTFTVSLSWLGNAPVTMNYATANGTARHGTDYLPAEGSLHFAPGELAKAVIVRVKGDTVFEQDETFFLNLSDAIGATLADGQGVGTILNDDGRPRLSVSDVRIQEGQLGLTALVFTVTLSHASEASVTVAYSTADGSARAGEDYLAASGTLVFDPGETTKTVTVWILGDLFDEEDEAFFLDLSGAAGALIDKPRGVGTILDDDW